MKKKNIVSRRRRRLSATEYTFSGKKCLGKFGNEYLKSQEESFIGEIDKFKLCAGQLIAPDASLASWDLAIDKCLKIRTGIAHQYFYRSLYAVQLYHYFKYFPKSQMLVLPSERLLADPKGTISTILNFLGVSDDHKKAGNSQDIDLSTEAIQKLMDTYFPNFEKNSGWRAKSEYPPMDAALNRSLTLFFKPFSDRLSEMLGNQESFSEWWGGGV